MVMSIACCRKCHRNHRHSTPCQSHCSVPVTLLKSCANVFVPIIGRLANVSFTEGHFPARYKKAQGMPLLTKLGLDSSSPSNYRPISNLSTIWKILERLMLVQLRPHLLSSANFSEYQSGYRTGHSTETALLEVLLKLKCYGVHRLAGFIRFRRCRLQSGRTTSYQSAQYVTSAFILTQTFQ